ncbi:MAG: hypothetical protein OXH87_00480 [Rhodospirillaceae bacterium]|nr:hypothetical protein [Rhodospirillaceae bacterium]
MVAAAAMAAAALSGCGGGSTVSSAQESVSSPFSRGARGITVEVSRASGEPAAFVFSKGGAPLTAIPTQDTHRLLGFSTSATNTAWPGSVRRNDASVRPSERIVAYSDIEAESGGTADDDYLLFGYWNSIGGTREVAPFYWGPMPYTADLPTAGAFSYSGGAAGQYRSSQANSVGHFTADVRLAVDFGRAGGPVLDLAFDNFALRKITALDPPNAASWSFSSRSVPLTGPSFDRAAFSGDGGTWSARFFGPSRAAPTGVAGAFRDVPIPASINPSGFSITGSYAATR